MKEAKGKVFWGQCTVCSFITEACASIKAWLKLALWVVYRYVTNHSKASWFKAIIIIYFVPESVIWSGLQWGWLFADDLCGISCKLGLGGALSQWFTSMSASSCWLEPRWDCGPWSLWVSSRLLALLHTMMSGVQEGESHGGSAWHFYIYPQKLQRVIFSELCWSQWSQRPT